MAPEERAHTYGEGWGDRWLKSWDDDSQICELTHQPLKQDFVQSKPLQGKGENVSWTLTHFIPGWVILSSFRFIHAFYLPGYSREAGVLSPTRSQKSFWGHLFILDFRVVGQPHTDESLHLRWAVQPRLPQPGRPELLTNHRSKWGEWGQAFSLPHLSMSAGGWREALCTPHPNVSYPALSP